MSKTIKQGKYTDKQWKAIKSIIKDDEACSNIKDNDKSISFDYDEEFGDYEEFVKEIIPEFAGTVKESILDKALNILSEKEWLFNDEENAWGFYNKAIKSATKPTFCKKRQKWVVKA